MKAIIYHNDSDITRYLIEKDPLLAPLFKVKKHIEVRLNHNYFHALLETIIAQQLSSKVAFVISKRVHVFYDNDITPEIILKTDDQVLRSLGLSFQKIKYLKSLAEHVISDRASFDRLEFLSDQEIIEILIKIKGIGIWTAQMFLMFSLGREDVFSSLDLGLRNALKIVYKNPDLTIKDIDNIAINWSPYRSVVAHFLWHLWDNTEE